MIIKTNKLGSFNKIASMPMGALNHVTNMRGEAPTDFYNNLLNALTILRNHGCNEAVVSDSKKFIKVAYDYSKTLEHIANDNPSIFKSSKYGNKTYLLQNDGRKFVKVIETGSGSIGKMPTITQERLLCMLYNDQFQKERVLVQVKEHYGELWAESMKKWITAINERFPSDEYRAVRIDTLGKIEVLDGVYHVTDDEDYLVADHYDKLCKEHKIVNQLVGLRREYYDKSDVLMYKRGISLNKIKTLKDIETSPDIHGISLKKMTSVDSACQLVYSKDHMKVKVKDVIFKDVHNKKGQVKNYYAIDFVTIEDEVMTLTMRTFGNNNLALDIKQGLHPSLGKCPVKIWTSMIDYSWPIPNDNQLSFVQKMVLRMDYLMKYSDAKKIIQSLADHSCGYHDDAIGFWITKEV